MLQRIGALGGLTAACVLWLTGCGGGPDPGKQPAVQHYTAAVDALAAGDQAKAMESLTKSIESKATAWAYMERAKLYEAQGDDAAATADCQSGLELDPNNADFKWLQGELKKAKDKRFKGKFAKPPSASK